MKTRFYLLTAAAAMMLAGCSNENELAGSTADPLNQPEAVQFGSYIGRTAVSRAVESKPGNITATDILAGSGGFAVFATYTGASTYASTTPPTPNFMYNQHVTSTDGSTWKYSPVKYWPNEFTNSAVDNQDPAATGTTARGMVSFFAYAPWGNGTSTDASKYTIDKGTKGIDGATIKNDGTALSTGITKLSTNDYEGNPTLTYVLDQNVDLMWGTLGSSSENAVGTAQSGTSDINTAKTLSGGSAPVNIDMTKQKVDGNVQFNFKHALARIGNIKVKSTTNENSAGTAGETKVSVQSVTISASQPTPTAQFDLAKGTWSSHSGATDLTISGNTYSTSTDFATDIYDAGTLTTAWSSTKGITASSSPTAADLFASGKFTPILFLPGTKPSVTISITYTVRTKDESLSIGCSAVPQTITKTVTFADNLAQGTSYTLTLDLNLLGVKFSAAVDDTWSAGSETEVDMPLNVSSGS